MVTRIIEAPAWELATLEGRALVDSIRSSAGRTVAAEIVAFAPPLVNGLCNAGLCAILGADIVHLNHYDVQKPLIAGLPSTGEGLELWAEVGLHVAPTSQVEAPVASFLSKLGLGVTIHVLRAQIGRVVGVSLDVVADDSDAPSGRLATPGTAAKAVEQGAAYITLVGTPGLTPETLQANVRLLRKELGREVVLVAGRMPWGGLRADKPVFLSAPEIEALVAAGVDMVMLPVPGTIPGASLEVITALVDVAHRVGALAQVTIGTSQESAGVETVGRLALDGKLTGADIFQIGDGGYGGMSIPDNILAFATAIKGRRHTYKRMASTGESQ
jgi:hypothetical protein